MSQKPNVPNNCLTNTYRVGIIPHKEHCEEVCQLITEYNSLQLSSTSSVFALTRSSQKRPDTIFLNRIIHLPPLKLAES